MARSVPNRDEHGTTFQALRQAEHSKTEAVKQASLQNNSHASL